MTARDNGSAARAARRPSPSHKTAAENPPAPRPAPMSGRGKKVMLDA